MTMKTWARPSPRLPPSAQTVEDASGHGHPPPLSLSPIPYLALDEAEDLECLYVIPMELHYGAEEFDFPSFLRWREWVRGDPRARVILIGDVLEFATRDSVGDVYGQPIPPEEQMLQVCEVLDPIRDRIWAITEGNHEGRAAYAVGIHPGRWVAFNLGIPYFPGRQGVLKVRLGRGENGKPVAYIIAFAHGSSSARTPGGKLAAAWRFTDVVWNADVYITGHSHGHIVDRGARFVVDPHNNLVREEKFYIVMAGSFLGYAGYARERAWAPLGVGCPRIRLDGRRKDVHVSI